MTAPKPAPDETRAVEAMRAELAELRAELAARRAIDGWLRVHRNRFVWRDRVGTLCASTHDVHVGVEHDAEAPTYPELCSALGIEVTDG
jgi:hypothetical protein